MRKYRRSYARQRTYGIAIEDYDRMFTEQNGLCLICEQPETRKRINDKSETADLAVDHNHETGVIRGLLCSNCNNGLGRFNDNPDLLEKAAEYLRARGHYG